MVRLFTDVTRGLIVPRLASCRRCWSSVSPLFFTGLMPQAYTTTLNLDTGNVTRACVTPQPPKEGLDFPQLNQALVGRKNRWGASESALQ